MMKSIESILKSGEIIVVRKLSYNEIADSVARLKIEQDRILSLKKIDYERLRKTYITI